jgi:hypothetical protein
MANTYKVTFLSEEHGVDTTVECSEELFVLDAAEMLVLIYHTLVVQVLVLHVLVK